MTDESDLIQRILAGDEGAKDWLYRTHRKRLYVVAVHFLGYRDPEAEDMVQETFLIALEKMKDFKPRSTLYTWMAHITVNLCFERLRRRKRQLVTLQEDLEHMATGLSMETHEKLGHDEEHRILLERLKDMVGRLDKPCRWIVELRDLKGKSYASIGKKLRLPIGTVMSRLARCREILKRIFSGTAQGGNV